MRRDDGFLTVQYLVAVGLGLLLFTMLANLIVFQYGRGVLRTGLDEAARNGARTLGSPEAAQQRCQATAERTRADLLGGALGEQVELACAAGPREVTAIADATFEPWLPGVPAWHLRLEASATQEQAP